MQQPFFSMRANEKISTNKHKGLLQLNTVTALFILQRLLKLTLFPAYKAIHIIKEKYNKIHRYRQI